MIISDIDEAATIAREHSGHLEGITTAASAQCDHLKGITAAATKKVDNLLPILTTGSSVLKDLHDIQDSLQSNGIKTSISNIKGRIKEAGTVIDKLADKLKSSDDLVKTLALAQLTVTLVKDLCRKFARPVKVK